MAEPIEIPFGRLAIFGRRHNTLDGGGVKIGRIHSQSGGVTSRRYAFCQISLSTQSLKVSWMPLQNLGLLLVVADNSLKGHWLGNRLKRVIFRSNDLSD